MRLARLGYGAAGRSDRRGVLHLLAADPDLDALIRTIVLALALTAAVVLAVAFVTLLKLYRIPSSAMEPTLRCARPQPGCSAGRSDRVAALRADWPFEGVGRGDIVFFRTPPVAAERCGSGGIFVKRIIGLPGEVWAERHGVIVIDGRPLDEPYVSDARRDERETSPRKIPLGRYLVLGDNRVQSCDLRVWGPLPKKNIVAKALLTYWPPSRIAFR